MMIPKWRYIGAAIGILVSRTDFHLFTPTRGIAWLRLGIIDPRAVLSSPYPHTRPRALCDSHIAKESTEQNKLASR